MLTFNRCKFAILTVVAVALTLVIDGTVDQSNETDILNHANLMINIDPQDMAEFIHGDVRVA